MKQQLLLIASMIFLGACVTTENKGINDSKSNHFVVDTTGIYSNLKVYEILDSVDKLLCVDVAEELIKPYKEKAIDMLEVAAQRGHHEGVTYYGCELLEGYCIDVKIDKGLTLLQWGIDNGNDDAMLCKAFFLFKNGDVQKGIDLFERAANLNNEWASLNAASIFLLGKVFGDYYVNPNKDEILNPDKGIFYLKKSAEMNLTEAEVLLGKMYLDGYDGYLEINKEEGKKFLKRALKDSSYTQFIYVESILNLHFGEGKWK